jgi:hypothetical protein
MKKTLTLIFICLLIITTLTSAAQIQNKPIPTPVIPAQSATLESIQTTISQEGVKTRQEVTTYIDGKSAEILDTTSTNMKNYVASTYTKFYKDIYDLWKQIQVAAIITIFATIILANAVWYAIKRLVEKKDRARPRYLLQDKLLAKKYGLATDEHLDKIHKEDKTIYEQKQTPDHRYTSPTPPTMSKIEEIIARKKAEIAARKAAEAERTRENTQENAPDPAPETETP